VFKEPPVRELGFTSVQAPRRADLGQEFGCSWDIVGIACAEGEIAIRVQVHLRVRGAPIAEYSNPLAALSPENGG
jgi:hypothetical protein